jgi:hypothetical protein
MAVFNSLTPLLIRVWMPILPSAGTNEEVLVNIEEAIIPHVISVGNASRDDFGGYAASEVFDALT